MIKKICLVFCLFISGSLFGMRAAIHSLTDGSSSETHAIESSPVPASVASTPRVDEQLRELRTLTTNAKRFMTTLPSAEEQAALNKQLGITINCEQPKAQIYSAICMAAAKKRAQLASQESTTAGIEIKKTDVTSLRSRVLAEEQAADTRVATKQTGLEKELAAAFSELSGLRSELTETQEQFALLGERYGQETEEHAREITQARAKINALEIRCQQQETTVKDLMVVAEERIKRAKERS